MVYNANQIQYNCNTGLLCIMYHTKLARYDSIKYETCCIYIYIIPLSKPKS